MISSEDKVTLSFLFAMYDNIPFWVDNFPIDIKISTWLYCKVETNLLSLYL